jgi:hypothetical protein
LDDAFSLEQHAICKACCTAFTSVDHGYRKLSAHVGDFYESGFARRLFPHDLIFSKDHFVRRSLSSSYSPDEKDPRCANYIAALEKLFDQYSQNGLLAVKNDTILYYGRPREDTAWY